MLSVPHMIVVFLVVLVVFGPQKLPELARSFGKLMAEFRKASNDFKNAFEEEVRDLERQARIAELKKQVAEANAAATAATTTTDRSMGSTVAATQGTPQEADQAQVPNANLGHPNDAQTQVPDANLGHPGEPVSPTTTEIAQVINPVAEAVPRETSNNGDTASRPDEKPQESSLPSDAQGATQASEPTPSHDEQQPA